MEVVSLIDLIRQMTIEAVDRQEAALGEARRVLARARRLRQPKQLKVKVTIESLWRDQDEKDVTVVVSGSVEEAICQAKDEFMRINERSDIQGTYRVFVVLPGEPRIEIELPEAVWRHLT